MLLEFEVPAAAQGSRLSSFLRAQGVSTTLLRSVKYQEGGLLVDGAPAKTNALLLAGQTVRLCTPSRQTAVHPQPLGVHIVLETPHYVLLDKPAGMAVHPTLNYPFGTLANAWLGELAARGQQGVFRPVNRIDKDTSGLVLCAKNAYAASVLAHAVQKVYLAVAEGELPLGPGVVDAPIARGEDSILRHVVAPGGKPSRTEYEVLATGKGLSVLRAVPITGRTHQIRLHMAHIGYPLAGDWLYGHGPKPWMPRHALHCFFMWLPTVGACPSAFAVCPPPADFQALYREIIGEKCE